VEFSLRSDHGDHRVISEFHIAGSEHRGKGPYHAAEGRYWVRGLDEPAPLDAEEEGWRSMSSTATPWSKRFPGVDAGKRLYIAMRWENRSTGKGGAHGKGPWSEIQSIIIP
jgi:hypothetical protein